MNLPHGYGSSRGLCASAKGLLADLGFSATSEETEWGGNGYLYRVGRALRGLGWKAQ